MNKTLLILVALATSFLGFNVEKASAESKLYFPDFPINNYHQVEVPITPANLVTGAYQGMYTDYNVASFATFDQQVAAGEITGETLVRAAYYKYRATLADLNGETDLIKDVDRYLDVYLTSK